ncbi:peptide/nickel transport system substrate-binding protein [Kribbella aluminosa]|uniref:Peptide/nickel transport system substrate-binding protein n=1 Tax=Kribbella aluminosa TaxID=416017 RepID=A0ABS4UWR7_9ACTN|nr:ABC transporter family substrate-binding protein [Kribbella aluminosa]MBP2356071.1 peptide/nickel transport system substrate-binding protein [Kribbella aluminosa]
MKFKNKGMVVGALLVLALAACSSNSPAGSGPKIDREGLSTLAQYNPQPRENIKDGGTLTTANGGAPDQLNPFHADYTSDSVQLFSWYNANLSLMSPDGKWSPNPDYLSDVKDQLVNGNRVVTYTINPKATFNDGTPIDWRAFETVWKVSNGKNKQYSVNSTDGYDIISSVKPGTNSKQAVVTYSGPWVWWQGQFNTLLNPKVGNPKTFNEGYIDNPHDEWGAGPYHIKSISKTDKTVVFERNPKWWGKPGKLDQRIFRNLESTAAINAFRNGELDAVDASSKEPNTQVKTMQGIDLRQSAALSTGFVALNPNSKTFSDPRVRQAVERALDRETLLKIKTEGMNYSEELPGSFVLYPFQAGYRDNLKQAGISYDEAAADKLLDDAGWAKGADGIRTKDGARLHLVWPIIGDAAVVKNVSVAAQAMLKKVGIELELPQRKGSEFADILAKKEYDTLYLGWATGGPDEGFYLFCQFYCSPDAGYSDAKTTTELAKQAKEIGRLPDKAQQESRFNDLEVEALKQYEVLPLFNGPKITAVKTGLANYGSGLFFRGRLEDIGWQK